MRTSLADCARGQGPTRPRAGRPASPAARTSRKSTRPISPTSRSRILRPGLIATPEQLARLGLVAPARNPAPGRLEFLPLRPAAGNGRATSAASRERRSNHGNTGPDISRADFTWCLTARLDWGWDIEEVAARLMELSSKARENGEQYALLTAQNAAAAVPRRRGQVAK